MVDRLTGLKALYEEICLSLAVLDASNAPDGDYAHPVFGEGDPNAALLLLGEAPGAEEAASGRPFVGKAGRQLDALLGDARVSRQQVYITNTVKYRPVARSERSVRNRTPSGTEITSAMPALEREIVLLRPPVIATLGNTPLAAVLALAGEPRMTIGSCHGVARRIMIDGHGCTLFPLYHPASGIYNRALIDVMRADARLLGEHLVKHQG